MKKFCFVLLCFGLSFVFAACAVNGVAFAEAADYQNDETYVFLKEFLTACPDRYGVEEEKKAAEYLKEKFNEVLSSVGTEATIVSFGQDDSKGFNVVANVRSNQVLAKTVIIGAHYDSKGEGANDNGSGVTALYFVMKELAPVVADLPFNVTFVAFGGEERGLLGSYYFVNGLSAAEKQDVLMMFNFDVIVNGDNLYVACENKTTSMANLILQNAPSDVQLQEKPYAQGVYSFDAYGYGYYETVQNSDHTPFRLQKIPTAMFFSGNFVGWDYVESVHPHKNNMNSNSDTLENLDAYNGGVIVERIKAVVQTTCNTVLSEDFFDVAQNARSELLNNELLFNAWWPKILLLVVLTLLAVLAWLYSRKLEKKSLMGSAEVKTEKVFSTPNADEIFSFDDKKSSDKSDDLDDIFDFKK